ncbi:RNA polymerase sigma factor [Ruminococcus albus]|uniref:RNA polymerase sigma-70 factor, ECF subfamily n=1 Tax=Ruminococcus albus TaxID=1264 RepID=A0A1H7P7S0_RUMAL|nr:RNA polymerase sigma factor [Ruminococcus albus]SEL31295.1 RNA polymerase sigma-70 factor, ECF subfamily [Ruminococcus albus]
MDEFEDDRELVELFLSRDAAAVTKTEKRYEKRLIGLAKSFLSDPRDAEECVNDTYLKAWNSIPPQKPEDLFSYLARLCRCTAYNIIEKQQTAKRSAQLVELTHEMEECIPDVSRSSSPDDKFISALINEFLDTLSKDKCDIFVKRYWFGESVEEIASETGFTASKVKTTLHRTREKLRKFLEKKGVQP